MNSGIVTMMLSVSLFLGAIALVGVMWAIKTGQFDDEKRMMDSVHDDGEESLNEAAETERSKKSYKPAD